MLVRRGVVEIRLEEARVDLDGERQLRVVEGPDREAARCEAREARHAPQRASADLPGTHELEGRLRPAAALELGSPEGLPDRRPAVAPERRPAVRAATPRRRAP